MKNFNLIAIGILVIAIVIDFGVHLIKPTKQTALIQTKKPIQIAKSDSNPILTPDTKSILGSSTSANLTTYTSQDGGYTLIYPANWTPATNEQIKSFSGNVRVFTIGPVGEKILGYPSFIQVAVDDNPQNLSLLNFASKQYGNITLTASSAGMYNWEATNQVHGPVTNTVYLTEQKQKIYQIRFYNGVEPKISQEQLHAVLASFRIK